MPGGTRAQLGNELFSQDIYLPTAAYPIVAANGITDNTVVVPGVLPGDSISWNMQAPPAHLVLDNAYVSAPGVITFRWSSDSTGITPAGTLALILQVARPENSSLGVASLPNSIT